MTELNIADDKCWVCGKSNKTLNLTKHHTLPKHLKPKHNVIVPLCEKCHPIVTADDVAGLYSYAYKLEKTLAFLGEQVRGIKIAVENQWKMKLGKKK